MLSFERLALVYLLALAVTALAQSRRAARARRALVVSLLVAVVAALANRIAPFDVRAWLGHLYLLAGYFVPSMLAPTPEDTRFERWLVAADRAWRPLMNAMPQALAGIFEFAYLLCYPLVPTTFAIVWIRGDEDAVNRFWVAVLAAGFACYGLLPWLVSRPPRSLPDADGARSGIARVNVLVLDRMSHRLNTFPSGHVAVAVAAALSVWTVSPAAGIVFGLTSAGIAIGAVVGRYHYVPDVWIGAVVGVIAGVGSWQLRPGG